MRTVPTSVDHTDDIVRRDQRTKRSLLPFALLIIVVTVIWLAFTHYM